MDSRVTVFDLGMVLVTPFGLFERMAQISGAPQDVIEAAYWEHRHAYDAGMGDLEYWERTLPLAGLPAEAAQDLLPALTQADIESWSQLRPDARGILEELRERGRKIAVLSNMPTTMAVGVLAAEWSSLVDQFYFSGPMGLAKPDPAIYSATQTGLSMSGSDIHFIDDKIENVEAAHGVGWSAHLWRDDADTRAWLVAEGLL